MSVIPEVLSSQTSPEQPIEEQELRRRPSFVSATLTYLDFFFSIDFRLVLLGRTARRDLLWG